MNLVFTSRVPKTSRSALEDLLFFNPRQHLVREGILHSLQRFGHPRVEEVGDELVVRVGKQDAQTLFACDRDRNGELVGLVVFLRTTPEEIVIIHVASHPDYALHGKGAGTGLGIVLVEKVKEISARIVGVKRIMFFYRQEVVIRI